MIHMNNFLANNNVFCSSNTDLHDLLLTVLWEAVVHTSANVRTTAAKMFEVGDVVYSLVQIF